jgi:hypothetical protein
MGCKQKCRKNIHNERYQRLGAVLMAGSFDHCLTEEGTYRGHDLLENMGDMKEAVEEMVFMLLYLKNRWGDQVLKDLSEEYYKCFRGEQLWPDFMKPGIED